MFNVEFVSLEVMFTFNMPYTLSMIQPHCSWKDEVTLQMKIGIASEFIQTRNVIQSRRLLETRPSVFLSEAAWKLQGRSNLQSNNVFASFPPNHIAFIFQFFFSGDTCEDKLVN